MLQYICLYDNKNNLTRKKLVIPKISEITQTQLLILTLYIY